MLQCSMEPVLSSACTFSKTGVALTAVTSVLPSQTSTVTPDFNEFTGFVFKLQANLDPRHRDRLAYIRVVSGRYEKGMKAWHVATVGKAVEENAPYSCAWLHGKCRNRPRTFWAAGDSKGWCGHGHIIAFTPTHHNAYPLTFLHFVFCQHLLGAVRRFPGAAQPHERKTSDTGARAAIVRARQGNSSRECFEVVGFEITELHKLVKHGALYSLSHRCILEGPVVAFAHARNFGIPPIETSALVSEARFSRTVFTARCLPSPLDDAVGPLCSGSLPG